MTDIPEKVALLANVADGIDAPMIIELLQNEGIECWAADSSSGSFLRSAIGFSPAGRQLYVPAEKLEQAKEVAHRLGVGRDIDPFMTLSFMALPVIPTLRITTRGVFDAVKFQYVT